MNTVRPQGSAHRGIIIQYTMDTQCLYTPIQPGTMTVMGMTDIFKHLQEMNGYNSTAVFKTEY